MAALPPELRERLVDRLRHAQQYAEAARLIAEGALAAFGGDEEVVAMTATRAGNVDEPLGDRLRDVEQFAEAARRMAEEALELVEAAIAEEPSDDGV
jgi:NTP pyrophosphatase (non-canonical NTP hydrolase)